MNNTSLTRLCKRAVCISAASTLALAPLAHAGGISDMSRASVNASLALPGALIFGTTQMLKDAGKVSVTAIRTVGKVTTLTLKAIGSGIEATVEVSAKVLEGIAIGTGVVLVATAVATGVVLSLAGNALVFIPNEVGSSLLHHSRASQ
jgi:hypothetical protein